jgi:hypothetical protein
MFVSAVETAANHWRSAEETPRERLHASKPKLENLLVKVGGQTHADEVAKMIANSLGSTKKFLDFIELFCPGEPAEQPSLTDAQHPWCKRAIRKSMQKVYSYRCNALHGGTPFPEPICAPPPVYRNKEAPAERPLPFSVSARGGFWKAEDLPIYLHTFEYIVQGALCKWWKDMVERRTDTAEGGCAT